jgi:hypothetical protein
MTLMNSCAPTTSSDQPAALALTAPAALIAGENAGAYEELGARILGSIKPADPFEEIWARDMIDVTWEVFRLRRLKANLMAVAAPDGMTDILRGLGETQPNSLARRWAAREPTAIGDVNERLAAAGLGTDAVMAAALAARIEAFERIERMLAAAEARRAGALQQLESRRDATAARLRNAAHAIERQVEDAEFEVVAPPDVAPEQAA